MIGRPIESDDYVLMGMMAEYCFVIEARKAGFACPGMVLERRFYFDGDLDFTMNGKRIAVKAKPTGDASLRRGGPDARGRLCPGALFLREAVLPPRLDHGR
ncbi:MAG: hypothetical protein IPG72_16165 [Ardenticatenales bacterium]|nr:hypothetical protein [Ardenticatenales bacterium]